MINNDHAINVYRSSMFIIFKYYNHKNDWFGWEDPMVIRTDRTTANYLRWNLGRIKHDGISECLCNLRHVFFPGTSCHDCHVFMFLAGNGPAASRHVKTIEVRKFLLGSNFQWRHVPIDGLLKLVVSNLCIPTMSDWHQLTSIDINWHLSFP